MKRLIELLNTSDILDKEPTIADMQILVTIDDETWNALKKASKVEGKSLHSLCKQISNKKPSDQSLANALKDFATSYA